jgi:hypothetical protein
MMHKQSWLVAVFVGACLALIAPAARAQSFGVRAGYASNPDSPVFGFHLETPGLTQTGHLTLRPSVEIGSRNDYTFFAGNLEVVYWAQLATSPWSMYFGAGPAVVYHRDPFEKRADGGFNGLIGFQHTGGLFVETKVGGGWSPSIRAMVGYVIKKK